MKPRLEDEVIWHDVECGGYSADLALWRELAASANAGAIIDVGAGSGRVALDLGLNGYEVVAVELEPKLAAALAAGLMLRGPPHRLLSFLNGKAV